MTEPPPAAAGGAGAPVGQRLRVLAQTFGPGFVSSVASNDPSGVGTYALAGARFGLGMLWTALATVPMLAVAQVIAARVAIVSGAGLSQVLVERYRAPVPQLAVIGLTLANVLVISADLAILAELGQAAIRLPSTMIAAFAAVGVIGLQVIGNYRFVRNSLRLMALALLAYILTAVVVRPDLASLVRATVLPTLVLDRTFLLVVVAILGTTVSPYLFWWLAAAEVEEERLLGRAERLLRRGATGQELRRTADAVVIGSVVSNIVMWAVIVTAAGVFHAHGVTLNGTADAANLLRPIAGDLAGALFALGLIGSARLAIPVISGSTAYAVAELLGWRHGLNESIDDAPWFYAVLIVATALAVALIFFGSSAISLVLVAGIVNGVTAPVLLALIVAAAQDPRVMGTQPIGTALRVAGWATVGTLAVAALTLAVSVATG